MFQPGIESLLKKLFQAYSDIFTCSCVLFLKIKHWSQNYGWLCGGFRHVSYLPSCCLSQQTSVARLGTMVDTKSSNIITGGHAKVSANIRETNLADARPFSVSKQTSFGVSHRPLRPRVLCLIGDDGNIDLIDVEKWEKVHGPIEYLFITYTSKQFRQENEEDLEELHRISIAAAQKAGISAYWIGCSCIPQIIPSKMCSGLVMSCAVHIPWL